VQSITDDFCSLLDRFCEYFFWEELPTNFSNRSEFIVDRSSAVLDLARTERAGINATHQDMVKFGDEKSSDYRTIAEAISRYCKDAPKIIEDRWKEGRRVLNQLRREEAYELTGISGFDVSLGQPTQRSSAAVQITTNKPFFPPEDAEQAFIGRQESFRQLERSFFPAGVINTSPELKSFVVYGMGGVGKTQLCSQFAKQYRNQYGKYT
jgi:hypothetical protein